MDKRVNNLIKNWQKRNIQGFYCRDKESALNEMLEVIPVSSSVGFSGSVTLDQLGAIKHLIARGNTVFNPYKEGISRGESMELRRQGALADYYLASPNAISEKGELVFFSAYGNRTTGVSYARNVIVVAGINKITPNLEEAIKRSREQATPLNCKRLKWESPCFADGICHQEICFAPEYKRMCCQILIIEAEVTQDRLKVILVGENLGF
ncbi:MAG: lactate utilization protein [Candidatus Omnitrophica bacterium]|nr:lactate utilization protein [Candidatus Omnitrophota bacterium]